MRKEFQSQLDNLIEVAQEWVDANDKHVVERRGELIFLEEEIDFARQHDDIGNSAEADNCWKEAQRIARGLKIISAAVS